MKFIEVHSEYAARLGNITYAEIDFFPNYSNKVIFKILKYYSNIK